MKRLISGGLLIAVLTIGACASHIQDVDGRYPRALVGLNSQDYMDMVRSQGATVTNIDSDTYKVIAPAGCSYRFDVRDGKITHAEDITLGGPCYLTREKYDMLR